MKNFKTTKRIVAFGTMHDNYVGFVMFENEKKITLAMSQCTKEGETTIYKSEITGEIVYFNE